MLMNSSLDKTDACPLCASGEVSLYYRDKRREYFQCAVCRLVFVPRPFWLDVDAEKAEYDKHINSPDDAGYRKFLGRLCGPLLDILPAGASGLDFGCGPGPTLSVMFNEMGLNVALYDKFYYSDRTCLHLEYDFVTATEVWEHLQDPRQTLNELWRCVKPGGLLGVMTKLVANKAAFASWHYKNDPTHIVFFSLETLQFVAKQWRADLVMLGTDAFYFTKARV